MYIFSAYTPGWNDPPSYSFEDSVSAQQENRPKIFDRIPARVLPSAQISQSGLGINTIPLDNIENISKTESGTEVLNSSVVSSTSSCDIPEEERLTYVMTTLNNSIKNSTLLEVNEFILNHL